MGGNNGIGHSRSSPTFNPSYAPYPERYAQQ